MTRKAKRACWESRDEDRKWDEQNEEKRPYTFAMFLSQLNSVILNTQISLYLVVRVAICTFFENATGHFIVLFVRIDIYMSSCSPFALI